MQLTLLRGYPDFVGKRATFVGYGSGPAAYNAATGDPITLPRPNYYIDAIPDTISLSGTYRVSARPIAGTGARQSWALFWFTQAGGAAPANLSAEQVQISGFCGQY